MKNNEGFTLVEALVAMIIVIFVVVTILSGFTQQMVTNRYAGAKNIAISLAESKMEQYLKFPASQMPPGSVDFVVDRDHRLIVTTTDPIQVNQFRRTASVTASGAMRVVHVTVEYGMRGGRYPFRVELISQKGG